MWRFINVCALTFVFKIQQYKLLHEHDKYDIGQIHQVLLIKCWCRIFFLNRTTGPRDIWHEHDSFVGCGRRTSGQLSSSDFHFWGCRVASEECIMTLCRLHNHGSRRWFPPSKDSQIYRASVLQFHLQKLLRSIPIDDMINKSAWSAIAEFLCSPTQIAL